MSASCWGGASSMSILSVLSHSCMTVDKPRPLTSQSRPPSLPPSLPSSRVFLYPVFRESGYMTLISQFQDSCFLFTFLGKEIGRQGRRDGGRKGGMKWQTSTNLNIYTFLPPSLPPSLPPFLPSFLPSSFRGLWEEPHGCHALDMSNSQGS